MGFYSNPFSPWHLIQSALEHSCLHLEKEMIVFLLMKRDLIHTAPTGQWEENEHVWNHVWVQPPKIQTWLLGKVWGEDGSSHIYNDNNKQTLFLTSTAELRDNFPLTTHIEMVTVSFHFSPEVVYAGFTLLPVLFQVQEVCYFQVQEVCYNERGIITT